jgi:hypothetical protein
MAQEPEKQLTPIEELLRDMEHEEHQRIKRRQKNRQIQKDKEFWPAPNLVPRSLPRNKQD